MPPESNVQSIQGSREGAPNIHDHALLGLDTANRVLDKIKNLEVALYGQHILNAADDGKPINLNPEGLGNIVYRVTEVLSEIEERLCKLHNDLKRT